MPLASPAKGAYLEIGGFVGKVVSAVHKKGGVGKTVINRNIAAALKEHPVNGNVTANVLLIDLDSQASLTKLFTTKEIAAQLDPAATSFALLDSDELPAPEQVIHPTADPNTFIVPSCLALDAWDRPLPMQHGEKQFAIRDFIEPLRNHFDWIVLDPPPKMSVLPAWNCLMAADFIISVLNPEQQSCDAREDLAAMLWAANEVNKYLYCLGYLVNAYDARLSIHKLHLEALQDELREHMFSTVVHSRTTFKEADAHFQDVFQYAPRSDAAKQIRAVAKEVIAKIQACEEDYGRAA